MSNESSYALIADLIANVYDNAMHAAFEGNVIAPHINVWQDSASPAPRIFGSYSGGTFLAIAETVDNEAQAFNASSEGTLTPAVYAQMIELTNRRLAAEPGRAQREAGIHLGNTLAEAVDTQLAGLFSSFTAGTVGSTTGGTATWANIFLAQAKMRTNKLAGPYTCILHPVQWYYLTSAATGVPTLMQSEKIKDSVVGTFYQASFGGIDFYVDANIASGTAAVGAMFVKDSMVLDVRQGLKIEPQYQAKISGNGGWELNASMMYAYGVYRPTHGVQIVGTSI
jgi:hypothetical protein